MDLWLLTMVTLLTATRPRIGSALIQSKTFLQRPDLADEVFAEGLLFQSPARSNLECLWRCSSTPSCVSYTHTPSSGTRGGSTCRGHASLVSVQTPYVAAPGSKTFVSTAGKLQSAGEETATNVAYQKPARQSSTYAVEEQASKAVDNNTDPNYNSHSCAITQHENQGSWWQVDLLQPYNIYSVVITNRGDCCGSRLHDFDVHIYSEDPVTNPAATATLCYHYPGPMQDGVTEHLPCNSRPITGRVIRVTNAPKEFLQLCEVQVLAVPT